MKPEDRSKEPTKVEKFPPSTALADKLRSPGGKTLHEMVGSGERALATRAVHYVTQARKDLDAIIKAKALLKSQPQNVGRITQVINRHGHQIKGAAGSFGYTLLTMVADSLVSFVERLGWHDLNLASQRPFEEVLDLHLGAMDVILKSDLKGDGGQIGHSLLNGLMKAVDKRIAQLPPLDSAGLRGQTLGKVE